MGAPRHGKNGLIYISGTEIVGANGWSISIDTDLQETPQFGDGWKKHVAGLNSWNGSVTVWDHEDSSALQDAATAGISVALLIYPVRTELTDYYAGNAIFTFSSEGGTGGAVSNTSDFTGDDSLTVAGFT